MLIRQQYFYFISFEGKVVRVLYRFSPQRERLCPGRRTSVMQLHLRKGKITTQYSSWKYNELHSCCADK